MHTRKFRTVIFTKRTVSRIIIFTAAAVTLGIAVGAAGKCIASDNETVSISGDIGRAVLENRLPTKERRHIELSDILGFDLNSPKTILRAYSPLFSDLQTPAPTEDNTSPTPAATPLSSEQPEKEPEVITANGGLKITNATKYSVDANELAKKPMPFEIDKNGVQVLIVHTHTTESYTDTQSYSSNDRTTDENKNIVAVGNVIADILNKNGIKTVHDTTVHDYPSYNGAYTRALTTIKKNIGENPTIKVVLDVHRDGIVREDGTKVKVLTDIDGKSCAQVMIVAGSNASGLSHEHWQDNMIFASHIQKNALDMYPTLMRPINLREERFNTHMTKGSIILEVGSNGNTLEEAKRGAEYAAYAICKTLKNE